MKDNMIHGELILRKALEKPTDKFVVAELKAIGQLLSGHLAAICLWHLLLCRTCEPRSVASDAESPKCSLFKFEFEPAAMSIALC